MANAQLWHARPIFITSTFRDMHAERDYLRNVVFPELEERLKERRHRLEPIDLRWGIETVSLDEEKSKELLVLKVCLGEIERSRPFLIALIGDRYGWVPPQDRLAAAAQEAGFSGSIADKSITALEIEYGILEKPGQRQRSHFYFREPLPYNAMPAEIAAIYSDLHNPNGQQAHQRLLALKERIRQDKQLKDRVHDYQVDWNAQTQTVTGLQGWGRMVLEDLWADLEVETRASLTASMPTWQEQERWALEEFFQNRNRGFIGRRDITDEIMHHALSPDAAGQPWGLCLTGEPGSGKSALFCHICQLLQKKEVLLLANAAGISTRSAEVDAILQRWIEELVQFVGETAPLPEKPTADELLENFTRLLGRAAGRTRVVVLLDSLNQLEQTPRARQLTWLPKQWPPNVRLFATTLPSVEVDALCGLAGVALKNLTVLQPAEAQDIIDAICDRYHRTMHLQIAKALLNKKTSSGKPASGIPLWLELATEELNLLDADDFSRLEREYNGSADEQLHQLLLDTVEYLPGDVQGLFAWMLARNEVVYGTSWSRAFAVLISLSRSGWRESDLRELLPQFCAEPWDELRFAVLRRGFRSHLVQAGSLGQYDFFHQQMRLAIERRYLSDASQVKEWHDKIASYLAGLTAIDPLRQNERMYHLIAADNQAAAAHYYAEELDEAELDGATRALAAHILAGIGQCPNAGLGWALNLLKVFGLTDSQKGIICQRFNFILNNALENNSDLSTRLSLLQPVLEVLSGLTTTDPTNNSLQHDLSASFNKVGDIFCAKGDLASALKIYQNSLTIAEKLVAENPSNNFWLHNLMVSFYKVGEVFCAKGDLGAALKAYQNSLNIAENLTVVDPDNIDWQHALSVSYERIGEMFRVKGDLTVALEAFQNSLDIAEKMAAADPDNNSWQRILSMSYERVGEVFRAKGDLAAALKAFKKSLNIVENLMVANPDNTDWQHALSVSYERVGDVFQAKGDLAAALKAFESSLDIRKKLSAADHDNTDWQRSLSVSYNKIGEVFRAKGDLAASFKAFKNSLRIAKKLTTVNLDNTEWQGDLACSYRHLGEVFQAKGDLTVALKAYQNSLDISEKLTTINHDNTDWHRNLSVNYNKIGEVYRVKGDLAAALKAFQNSLDISEKLADKNPDNKDWQCDLSVSYERVGDMFQARGDIAAALQAFQNSLNISEKLSAADSDNTDWQSNLLVSYIKIGDVYRAKGDIGTSLKAFQNSLNIAEKIVASNPDNTYWRRNFSVSCDRVGDMFRANDDLAAALKVFQNSLDIRKLLAATDPDNTDWQRDLSVSYNKIGEIFHAKSDFAAAHEAFQNSLDIVKKLVAADPDNTDWQRDLSVSYNKIGEVFHAKSDFAAALTAFQNSLKIREKLAALDSENTVWQRDLSVNYNKIGEVFRTKGDLAAALKAFQKSLNIREKLAITDPDNSSWQRDLILSWRNLASVLLKSGDYAQICELFKKIYLKLKYMREKNMYIDPGLQNLWDTVSKLEHQGILNDPITFTPITPKTHKKPWWKKLI